MSFRKGASLQEKFGIFTLLILCGGSPLAATIEELQDFCFYGTSEFPDSQLSIKEMEKFDSVRLFGVQGLYRIAYGTLSSSNDYDRNKNFKPRTARAIQACKKKVDELEPLIDSRMKQLRNESLNLPKRP